MYLSPTAQPISRSPASQTLCAIERILSLGVVCLNARASTADTSPVSCHGTRGEGQTIRSHSGDDQFASYVEVRDNVRLQTSRLVRSFEGRLAETQSTLRRGEHDDIIPEFVVAEGIDLVVMGTVAQSGIAGMLIGNTAERVLRKLPCSVLAVKPEGFTSPVRFNAS